MSSPNVAGAVQAYDTLSGKLIRAAAASDATANRPTSLVETALARKGASGSRQTAVLTCVGPSIILSAHGLRAGAGVLGRGARPRRDSRRTAARTVAGRGRHPRAVQRHQPRNRIARLPGPGPCIGAGANGCTVPGGDLPGPGE